MDSLVKQLVRHNESMMEMLQTHRDRLDSAMQDTPDGPVRDQFEQQLAGIDKLIADVTPAPTKAPDGDEDSPALGSPRHNSKMRVEVSVNIGMMRTLPEVTLSIEARRATDEDWSNAIAAATLLSEAAHQLAEDATVAASADKVAEEDDAPAT